MNDRKLNQLFAAARKDAAPPAPADFAADVLRAVRNAPPVREPAVRSVFDQLNAWFPRLAVAAALVIILCVAVDYSLGPVGSSDVASDDSQVSSPTDTNGGDTL